MGNLQQKLSEYASDALDGLKKLSEHPFKYSARALKELVQDYRSAAAAPLSAATMKLRGIGKNLKGFYEPFFYDKWSYAAAAPLSAATVGQFYLGKPENGMYTGLASLMLLSILNSHHRLRAFEPELAQADSQLTKWQVDSLSFLKNVRGLRTRLLNLPESDPRRIRLMPTVENMIANLERDNRQL